MWHPWRALRRRTDIDLYWTGDLPDGVRGVTDGQRIWMDDRQLQAERRCTLAHELEHIARGHASCASALEEALVSQAVARQLITIQALLDALAWSEELEEVADDLWVDLDTLCARLDGLTAAERAQIAALYAEKWRADADRPAAALIVFATPGATPSGLFGAPGGA